MWIRSALAQRDKVSAVERVEQRVNEFRFLTAEHDI
jgi:hypothetical protein